MNADLRKLYLYHLFNGIAISVVGNYVFLDKLFLRFDLDMKQLGLIKGIATWVPLTVGLLLSPLISRMLADRQIIGVVYLFRVTVPLLLLWVPSLTRDPRLLTLANTAILTTTFVFPVIGQNCMQVIFKEYLPDYQLGKQVGSITILWTLVASLAVIPCGWYLDRHSHGSDSEFLRAFLVICLATTVMQLPASLLIWRLSPPRATEASAQTRWIHIFEPFRNGPFRSLLSLLGALGALGAMVDAFINPYLFSAYNLPTYHVILIDGGVMLTGIALVPGWGHMTDRFGGKNVLRVGVIGIGIGLFFLAGHGPVFLSFFALLAWRGVGGIFGFAAGISRQILTIAMSEPNRTNIYVAAAGFVVGAGYFVGSVLGGNVLDWLAVGMHADLPFEHFRIYFAFCGAAFLLVGGLVSALPDSRPQLSPLEMAVAMWRSIRGRAGRA